MEFLKKNVGLFIAIAFAIIYILWERHKLKLKKEALNETKGDEIDQKPEYIPDPEPRPLPADWGGTIVEEQIDIPTGKPPVSLEAERKTKSKETKEQNSESGKDEKPEPFVQFRSRYSIFN